MGEKKKILLVCSAGMSTSLLMTHMQESAAKRNIEVDIMAMSQPAANKYLESKKVDLLLLGPQVRFMKKSFEKKLSKLNIPVEVIGMQEYGKMNGEKVLDDALRTINQH